MGTFRTTKTFLASPSLIPAIARNITAKFTSEGYEVQSVDLIGGGCDVSITKGGVFKAILGMKTALKVNIYQSGEGIMIDAGVGIFGQQAIPTVISMLFFWPVLITQISGMIAQAKLDDEVMMIAAETIARDSDTGTRRESPTRAADKKFCTHCGKQLGAEALFCSNCGNKL